MPVVPLVVRQAQQDVKIGDLLVPKNTIFITHFLAMHTSARYWERPLDFIPVSAAMLCQHQDVAFTSSCTPLFL
jgi:cytochrome P450